MLLAQWQGGLLASLLGSFSGTLGGQLRICSLACEGRWATTLQLTGWTFWLVGQALGQVAILLAPVTVAACVTFSGSLLCNALLAPLVLHERLTGRHGLGIVLLSVGAIVVTLTSSHSDQDYSWAQIRAFLGRPPFVAAGAACLVAAAALLASTARRARLDMWSFAYLFALCGALDLLVAKSTLQLLRLWAEVHDGGSQRDAAPPWGVLLCCTAAMVLLHLTVFCFQVASAYYRKALQSIPLFLGSGAMLQVSLCGLFFNEFAGFTDLHTAVFLTGFGLLLTGLVVTSRAAPAAPSPEMSDSPADSIEFRPPTSTFKDPQPKPKLVGELGHIPIISSGLFEKRTSSLSSTDLFLVGEMQKSAMVFGGHCALGRAPQHFQRRFGSAPLFQRPLSSCTASALNEPLMNRVASAPPGAWPEPAGGWEGCSNGNIPARLVLQHMNRPALHQV